MSVFRYWRLTLKRILAILIGLVVLSIAVAPVLAQSQPILSDITIRATGQRFEGGLMLWRSDNATIYVITTRGLAYAFSSATYSRLQDNPYFSREHAIRPINGFGKIWAAYGSLRRVLGWPTQPEIGFNMRIVTTGTTLYLVQKDGTIFQINRGTGAWGYASKLPTAPLPKPTATPLPPRPTPIPPRPTNLPPQSSAVIANFDVQPESVAPGGTVTVYWNILNVQQAYLEVYDTVSNNAIDLRYRLASAGSTTVTIPTSIQGDVRIVLTGAGRPGQPSTASTRLVQADFTVDVEAPPPPDQTISVYSAFQQYEHGFMLWRSDNGSIEVFFGAGSGSVALYPLPDNPYTNVPSGKVRPINGFGRIWGNFSSVRTGLGWATTPEQGYNSTIVISRGAPISFTLPNGTVVHLNSNGTWTF
jgi:hypothetical protein